MNLLLPIAAVVLVILNCGCASVVNLKMGQREIASQRILLSQNKDAIDAMNYGVPAESAIKAIRLGDNGIGLSVDMFSLDTIWQTWKKHCLRSTGAFALDILTTYLGIEAINNMSAGSSSSDCNHQSTVNIQNADNVTINVSDTSKESQ